MILGFAYGFVRHFWPTLDFPILTCPRNCCIANSLWNSLKFFELWVRWAVAAFSIIFARHGQACFLFIIGAAFQNPLGPVKFAVGYPWIPSVVSTSLVPWLRKIFAPRCRRLRATPRCRRLRVTWRGRGVTWNPTPGCLVNPCELFPG